MDGSSRSYRTDGPYLVLVRFGLAGALTGGTTSAGAGESGSDTGASGSDLSALGALTFSAQPQCNIESTATPVASESMVVPAFWTTPSIMTF